MIELLSELNYMIAGIHLMKKEEKNIVGLGGAL